MQVVVITGIAQGMGREVAKLLAGPETAVAGFDIDATGIDTLKGELETARCVHHLETLDAADRPGILRFKDTVLGRFGRVDVVLSNIAHANDTYAEKNNDVDSPLKTFCATLSVSDDVKPGQPIAITGWAQAGISGLAKVQVWIQDKQDRLPADDPYFLDAPWRDAAILPPPDRWSDALNAKIYLGCIPHPQPLIMSKLQKLPMSLIPFWMIFLRLNNQI